MIRKLIRQMLAAQSLSALTVSLCLLIDNIMICRFLGVQAIAAYGLANPILLVIGAIGGLLATGVQVACSKSLGSGSKVETDRGYSSALGLMLGISAVFMVLVLVFRDPLATMMGAGKEGELFAFLGENGAGKSTTINILCTILEKSSGSIIPVMKKSLPVRMNTSFRNRTAKRNVSRMEPLPSEAR